MPAWDFVEGASVSLLRVEVVWLLLACVRACVVALRRSCCVAGSPGHVSTLSAFTWQGARTHMSTRRGVFRC